uniref:Uncharacterized protein n=1 Tax=Rangifer tarandus platyrhynchus TaxID=3082113 RepID=A0ACB0E9F9_RANTA|nr:unnamed protein product [Rangifer tarandus platyrhynchus]
MFSSQPEIIKQLLTKSLEITAQRQNQITLQGPQEKVKVTSPPPLETLADSQLAETTVNPRLKNRGLSASCLGSTYPLLMPPLYENGPASPQHHSASHMEPSGQDRGPELLAGPLLSEPGVSPPPARARPRGGDVRRR